MSQMKVWSLILTVLLVAGCEWLGFQPGPMKMKGELVFQTNRGVGANSVALFEKGKIKILQSPGVYPRWSRDGKRIAFIDEDQRKVKVMNKEGEIEKEIFTLFYPKRVAWFPEGKRLLVAEAEADSYPTTYQLSIYVLESNMRRQLTGYKDYRIIQSIDVSPDGRTILFSMGLEGTTDFRTFTLNITRPQRKLLLRFAHSGRYSPDGKSAVFLITQEDASANDIVIYNFETKEQKIIGQVLKKEANPVFADEGKKIIYSSTKETGANRLWELDIETGKERVLLTEKTPEDYRAHDEFPDWHA